MPLMPLSCHAAKIRKCHCCLVPIQYFEVITGARISSMKRPIKKRNSLHLWSFQIPSVSTSYKYRTSIKVLPILLSESCGA